MQYHTLNNAMARNYTAYYTQEDDFWFDVSLMQVFMSRVHGCLPLMYCVLLCDRLSVQLSR